MIPGTINGSETIAISTKVSEAEKSSMAGLENLILGFLVDLREIIGSQSAQGKSVSNLSELRHVIVGCQPLYEAFVEILAGLEKVYITFFPLALLAVPVLLVLLRLLERLITGDDLAVTIVDCDMCIP